MKTKTKFIKTMKKPLSNTRNFARKMAVLTLLTLLTQCKTKIIPVDNYCVIAQPITPTCEDRKNLIKLVSHEESLKPLFAQIKTHNDIFYKTCKIERSFC
jgi:hypothetical protein